VAGPLIADLYFDQEEVAARVYILHFPDRINKVGLFTPQK
jgi:hypothetical protein